MNHITDLMTLDVVNRQWLKREKRKEFFIHGRTIPLWPGLTRPRSYGCCWTPARTRKHRSLRREVQYDDRHFLHEHRDATPLTWGRDFPYKLLVSRRGMELVGAGASS